MNKRLCISLVVVAIFSGCSDPQQANETNFKQSVQAYLDKAYPKCYFTGNFPVTTEKMFSRDKEQVLRALAKVGVLSETETALKKADLSNIWDFGKEKKFVPIYSYDLTEEGRKYYNPQAEMTNGGPVGGFCFGSAKVLSIDQFTAPADMMGQKVSSVSYSFSVSGFPEWAKNRELESLISDLKADIASEKTPSKEQHALILTNNGWIHEQPLR